MGDVVLHPCLTKRLVIASDQAGFALTLRPANTERERQCRIWRPTHDEIVEHATVIMLAFPSLYVGLVDESRGAA
ncbi:MAG: hypothetical protein ABW184_09970 [Sphingobium sp.]